MKIILKEGQQLFFTSDTHYSHKNICRATTEWTDAEDKTRDFRSLDHMNDTIVNNINGRVGEDDILFHLGDWSFGGFEKIQELRDRIVCKNIHLILGNHDEHIKKNKNNIQDLFLSVNQYLELEVYDSNRGKFTKDTFVLFHYPISSWNYLSKGISHIHGHTHLPQNKKIGLGRSIDCGMDGNNYMPYSLHEIKSLLKNQSIGNLSIEEDHHVK
jgi:calcineurin-like phosphoesterase family protein